MIPTKADLWDQLLILAGQHGYVFMEVFDCAQCSQKNYITHTGAETAYCHNCKRARPCQIPRIPQAEEIRAEDFITAVKVIVQARQGLQDILPSLTEDEISKSSPEIQQLITRNRLTVGIETAKLVTKVAEEVAQSRVK